MSIGPRRFDDLPFGQSTAGDHDAVGSAATPELCLLTTHELDIAGCDVAELLDALIG